VSALHLPTLTLSYTEGPEPPLVSR